MLHEDPTALATSAALPFGLPEETTSVRWLRRGVLSIPEPTDALELDALLRHLEIDGEFGDWLAAHVHLAEAWSTWRRLEPAIADRTAGRSHLRPADDAARDMALALRRATNAVDESRGGDVAWWARQAIEHVATIARVFQ
jgi:hypothetical protein